MFHFDSVFFFPGNFWSTACKMITDFPNVISVTHLMQIPLFFRTDGITIEEKSTLLMTSTSADAFFFNAFQNEAWEMGKR